MKNLSGRNDSNFHFKKKENSLKVTKHFTLLVQLSSFFQIGLLVIIRQFGFNHEITIAI